MYEDFFLMHENENFIRENEISCMKMNFPPTFSWCRIPCMKQCTAQFLGQNKSQQGHNFRIHDGYTIFSCMKMKYSRMKFSCHDYFMHDIFCMDHNCGFRRIKSKSTLVTVLVNYLMNLIRRLQLLPDNRRIQLGG